MMIDQVEAARRRIAELEEQIESLREFVATWERVSHLLSTPLKDLPAPPAGDSAPVDESAAVAEKPRREKVVNPPPAVIIPAAVAILKARGHPMSRRELHRALADRGIVVRGADPVKALGTILWRARDQIIQLEGYGYWPRATPYSRAGYPGLLPDHGPQEPFRVR